MSILINGKIKIDRKTKNLVKRLNSSDIAIIRHMDIDELSARSLLESKVSVILNSENSITGRYPNPGPKILVDAGILLIDELGESFFEALSENDEIVVDNNIISKDGVVIGEGRLVDANVVELLMKQAIENMPEELDRFVQNTLEYALKEKDLITKNLEMPSIETKISGRHVLIVVRGKYYKEDLRAIHSYIKEHNPVLIAVDGGADALFEFGLKPDIVIGDMDSVTDYALKSVKEIIVHAYPNGKAPGLERINSLGLKSKIFSAPGTSEDIAMLLAYDNNASLIVAVGTHSNLIDFLEKGRKGMSSTFLVRLKVGSILVDARGVAELHKRSLKKRYVLLLVLAAIIPSMVIIFYSPATSPLVNLIIIKLRIILGF